MRRASGFVSALLLAVLAIAIAEACLAALLLLFGFVLKVRLGIELGAATVQLAVQSAFFQPAVMIFNPATVASFLFTAGCGLAAATWRFRRWRPAR